MMTENFATGGRRKSGSPGPRRGLRLSEERVAAPAWSVNHDKKDENIRCPEAWIQPAPSRPREQRMTAEVIGGTSTARVTSGLRWPRHGSPDVAAGLTDAAGVVGRHGTQAGSHRVRRRDHLWGGPPAASRASPQKRYHTTMTMASRSSLRR